MSALVDCGRCASPLEAEDLRCAVCALPVPAVEDAPRRPEVQIVRCDGCGAAMSYDVRVRAPRCAFCDSIAHVETPEDPVEQAEEMLPFRVTPDEARRALRSWLGGLGFFRPPDLRDAARLEALTPMLFVAWVVDVEATVSWTADSRRGAGPSGWAPRSGQRELDVDGLLVSASRGLSADEVVQLAPHYDLGTATAPRALDGVIQECFDLQRSAARRVIARGVHEVADGRAASWVGPGPIRNLRVAPLVRKLRSRRCALPVHVVAYRYGDRVYRAVVHGQDARCVIGTAPWSWLRIALVVGAVLGLGLLGLALALA